MLSLVVPSPLSTSYRSALAELALNHRLPAMYGRRDYVEAGGLMSYGADIDDLNRRTALYIDKILKGAKPADLPVEQANNSSVNLLTNGCGKSEHEWSRERLLLLISFQP